MPETACCQSPLLEERRIAQMSCLRRRRVLCPPTLRADSGGATMPCPACRERPLRGSQRFCSPRCRAARHRRQQQARRQHRDEALRVLALAARQAIEAFERRLEDPT